MFIAPESGQLPLHSLEPIQIAIVGASGFVGLRTTEILSSQTKWNVRPIIRSASSLAVLSRQILDWRIVDLLSIGELAIALKGCSVCVHAAVGDAGQIEQMAETTYRACARAGVSRLVWLSSASVHGQKPLPGADETTPLSDNQPLAYNNAKVRAEWTLEKSSRDSLVEVVRLRPSIVYGPRSRWISDFANALQRGEASWLNNGTGLCNSIYIDNLVQSILLAATSHGVSGEAILLRDAERVTWREFMSPIARRLGFSEESFVDGVSPVIVEEKNNVLSSIVMSKLYRQHGVRVPAHVRHCFKKIVNAFNAGNVEEPSWRIRNGRAPTLSVEMALLQQCNWLFPIGKAAKLLAYQPKVSFDEGMGRSLSWIDFLR